GGQMTDFVGEGAAVGRLGKHSPWEAPGGIGVQPPRPTLRTKNVHFMLLPASGRELNLGEQLWQMHLEQLVDLRSGGDGKGSATGLHAIVLPILGPFPRGLEELTGEVHGVRKSLFNLQAAGQADIDVRLHDGKVARGYTLLPLAFLELVEVDINFAFRHGAAGEDLNVAGDVLSRITAFPLVGIVQ